MAHICARIEYIKKVGKEETSVGSDLCFDSERFELNTHRTREMLHAALDEWLDKGNFTGKFFVGDNE